MLGILWYAGGGGGGGPRIAHPGSLLLSVAEGHRILGASWGASPDPSDLSDHPSGSLQSTRATNRLRQPLFVQGLGLPVSLFHLDLLLQVFSPSHEILNLSVK